MTEHDQRSRFAYVCALTPLIFGTTYLLTTNFLPPDRPLLAALMRSLPTGIALVIGSKLPNRQWLVRFLILSVLWASAVFPLLFFAAYHLPGGVAAVINSLGPICVMIVAVPILGTAIRRVQLLAGALGVVGVALLVLRSNAKLDGLGILAMVAVVIMMAFGTVLMKRWGNPPGMGPIRVTGWTFLFAGITLLPFTLAFEGLPSSVTPREVGGLVYLVLISGIFAYALWFWGIGQLTAASVTFLGLLNPIMAALLGWWVLHQRLNALQLLGAALVLVSVVLGQQRRRRTTVAEPKPVAELTTPR
ncbi:DMT family transporter [Microlunatus antarcticus]|uniref:Putative blue pigment (Indigoidine) exporter n=1 Tax=Microlunatus antarcticus TaxID=53388 RepID=A0A7W5JYS0_9ACTN|nr:EamA family transporter [Microlunatus antarcticus]MBB3328824.1 putative blue pigment (indigoidine) exporter [Microlunatus antarcticus]